MGDVRPGPADRVIHSKENSQLHQQCNDEHHRQLRPPQQEGDHERKRGNDSDPGRVGEEREVIADAVGG